MQKLEETGQSDNTIILFISDHGWHLGGQSMWSKTTNYEIDTRVPLIFRVPKLAENGRKSNSLVELIDIYPTLCDLANISIPKIIQGKTLKPIFVDEKVKVKDVAFSQFPRGPKEDYLDFYSINRMGYAMRTDEYRYVRWIDFTSKKIIAEELYDLRTSLVETENIVKKPEQADKLNLLRDIFNKNLVINVKQ
ncbi:MAG: sulfatase-like hydrolase/transferase [Polaribacter sp.]|nr:sulfatase-like hydrolase/transferase [Polaribacter sp.]